MDHSIPDQMLKVIDCQHALNLITQLTLVSCHEQQVPSVQAKNRVISACNESSVDNLPAARLIVDYRDSLRMQSFTDSSSIHCTSWHADTTEHLDGSLQNINKNTATMM
jgi:hypothetical protein